MLARLVVDGVAVRVSHGSTVLISGYQPGNGSSYDLVIAPRVHGGHLVAWEGVGVLAIVREGGCLRGARDAELDVQAGRLPKPDWQAIARLCGVLYRAGVLS